MMQSKALLTFAVVALGASAVACTEDDGNDSNEYKPQVETSRDKNTDFTLFNTFDIIDPLENVMDPPAEFLEFQDKLEAEITMQLESKGLERTQSTPDLLVNPFVAVESGSTDAGWYDAVWGYYYGYEALLVVPVDYDEGTLALDVIDTMGNDDNGDDLLVYQGWAVNLLSQDPAVVDLQMRNSVKLIFDDWPTE